MSALNTAHHPVANHPAARMTSRPMPSKKTFAAVAAARIAANELPKGRAFTVPLSKLFLSPSNVRATKEPSAEGIARLAAMIEAEGLLADLHVSAETKDGTPTGRFAVEAGGRRWRALGLLVKQGKLSPDAPITCKGVEPQNATAVSLSENLGQEAMHPIDEFNAYAAMEKEGKTTEAIAQRFGVTVLHVQRRMRLAAVAPSLLALYRDEKATLDQMMALATVDDPKRQVAVWNSLPDYNRNAPTIRRRLTEEEVHCADPRVKLITLQRYIASGGTTRLDLFGKPGDEFLTDAGLVDLIVAEVLEEHAAKARAAGWGFVEVLPEYGYDERARFVQAPKVYKPETPEVTQQREAIEAQRDQANEKLEGLYDADNSDDEAQAEKDNQEIERLEAQIKADDAALLALHETLLDTSSSDKAGQGAVITFEGGQIKMHCGLVTTKQAQATAKLAVASGGSTDANGKPATARAEVPERLMLNLTAQSTAATQALLIANQSTALAVLAHRLALAVFDVGYHDHPAKLSLTPCMSTLERNSPSLPASRAAGLIGAEHEHWKQALPAQRDQWLAWLLTQPAEVVLRLLTYLCAVSYDAQKGTERTQPVHNQVAQAVSLDMADWWEANPANYLELVPKAKMMEAVTEAVGAQAATDMDKMKKAEAQAHAAAKLLGTRWLPAPLRRSAPKA